MGHAWHVDGTPPTATERYADPLLDTFAGDAGRDGADYLRTLPDGRIGQLHAGVLRPIAMPNVPYTQFAWNDRGAVILSRAGDAASVVLVDPATDAQRELARADGQVEIWASSDGRRLLIAATPFPEVDLDAGTTLTLVTDDVRTVVPPVRGSYRQSLSMSPDLGEVVYVDPNTWTVWSASVVGGRPRDMGIDADLAEISEQGVLAIVGRIERGPDAVCLRPW